MNSERLRELAEQAGADVWGDEVATSRYFDLEKFAELLVEEMYDFIMEESANDNGIPDLGKVKEHFGVKE